MIGAATVPNALLFSVQHFMVGEVSPALRGVSVDCSDEKTIQINCYYDGAMSEWDLDFMDCLRASVGGDFRPAFWVEVAPIRVRKGEPVIPTGSWAYEREEREPALIG